MGYPALNNISVWILLSVVPIALITGLGGSSMGVAILFLLKKKALIVTGYKRIAYTVVCGLIIAAFGYFISESAFGSGKEIMISTLFTTNKHLEWYIPIIRVIGPIVSFSTGAAGGIFAPSLSAGASIGAVFAGIFHLAASDTNLIILCGRAGFLTGITRSPFTSSILVVEMTNSHNIIFYIMLSALLANLISNIVSKHSFYDHLKDTYIKEIHSQSTQEVTN